MAGIVLNVEKRERTGTGGARATRNADLIPGVLYGGERGAIPIEIKAKDVEMAIRSGKFLSHMVELNHQGEKQPVIPRAIQFHPVTDKPIHVDLYRVEENAEIAIDVVVHFKNHADIARPEARRRAEHRAPHHQAEVQGQQDSGRDRRRPHRPRHRRLRSTSRRSRCRKARAL